jgi:hypothetical protein
MFKERLVCLFFYILREFIIRCSNSFFSDFHATNCNVTGLQAFWNYTIYVLAETEKGKTESDHVPGLTAETCMFIIISK